MTRLDTLPPEILFNILSYTEPTCSPNLPTYPLNALAETNKQLNAIVEEYARNLLKRHADIVLPRNTRVFTCRRKWLGEICYFCKKPSKRKACLYKALACCHKCDKVEFPKMTMTQATQATHLSKLDLFTPSPLHPDLPPLATGLYYVMGGAATMLSTPDVLARSAYIRSLLGKTAQDDATMRVRPARHERIIKHLNIAYYDEVGWVMREVRNLDGHAGEAGKNTGPKSMRTEESRREYAEKGLRREWAEMGVEPRRDYMACVRRRTGRRGRRVGVVEEDSAGESEERAIEID